MIIYLVAAAIPLIGGFFAKQKNQKKLLIATTMFILFLYTMRSIEVGVDIAGYYRNFLFISRTDWSRLFNPINPFSHYDKGYILFCKALSLLTNNANVFLFFCSLVIYIPLAVFIYTETEKMSNLCFFFYICMPQFLVLLSGIRQAIALAIVMIAFLQYRRKNYIYALIIATTSVFFHLTAIVAFIYPIVLRLKIRAKTSVLVIFSLFLVYFQRMNIAGYIMNISTQANSRYQLYEVIDNGSFSLFIFFAFIILLSFLLCDDNSKKMLEYRNMSITALVIQIMASTQSNIGRVAYYYIIFIPLLMVEISKKNRFSKEGKIILNAIFVFMLFFMLVYNLISVDSLKLLPYNFFWR